MESHKQSVKAKWNRLSKYRMLILLLICVAALYGFYQATLALYPRLKAPYWHLVNENPVHFAGREFTVPRGWTTSAVEKRGAFFIKIPYPSYPHVYITLRRTETMKEPNNISEEEMLVWLHALFDIYADVRHHEFKLISVPLPDAISRCFGFVRDGLPPRAIAYCVSNSSIFEYSYEGPVEYYPVFKDVMRNAERIAPTDDFNEKCFNPFDDAVEADLPPLNSSLF